MQGTLAYLNAAEAARLAEITTSVTRSIDVRRDDKSYLNVALSTIDGAPLGLHDRLLINAAGMIRGESDVVWRESFAAWREAHTS